MIDIADWLPRFDVRTRHDIDVAASPEDAYRAMRAVDLRQSPLVRTLLTARGMGSTATLDAFRSAGFVLLADQPPAGLVLGVIGRFWRPRGSLVAFEPEEFRAFEQPGFAKAAWCFEVLGRCSGSHLATETRVWCTDDEARRRFRRYWRVVGPFSGVIRTRMLRLAKHAAEHGARS